MKLLSCGVAIVWCGWIASSLNDIVCEAPTVILIVVNFVCSVVNRQALCRSFDRRCRSQVQTSPDRDRRRMEVGLDTSCSFLLRDRDHELLSEGCQIEELYGRKLAIGAGVLRHPGVDWIRLRGGG